ncbi:MAG: DUF805 domain-containing protein [Novosphingobium sp.]
MEWMLLPYRRLYALIAGRASRQEFWMFVLFNVIVIAIFAALFLTLVGSAALAGNYSQIGAAMAGAGLVTMVLLIVPLYLWAILTAVASFAVTIRRFHDLNLSGWVYLPFVVLGMIPVLNFLVWIVLIVMMCLQGTKGPNKYGDDPTAPAGADVFA